MGSNLYIATSGAVSRLQQLDTVANNLANSESIGFKADRAIFRAALESQLMQEGGERTPGVAAGVYVGMSGIDFDRSPGPIQQTGAPLDVALDGPGFFAVEGLSGERYTRAGSFEINSERQLVTPSGRPVLGRGGPIEVSGAGVRILASGDVVDSEGVVAGTLRIVTFEGGALLSKAGDGLLAGPPGLAPDDADDTALLEGSLEGSNVQPVVELAALMTLQRAFDAAMRAVQSEDQATERLIQEISQ